MAFERVVCWEPEDVHNVIDTEAIQTPDHIFLATHHPMKMYRQDWGSDAVSLDQSQFLEQFLSIEDFVFVPVLGDVGTGKSHLVLVNRVDPPVDGIHPRRATSAEMPDHRHSPMVFAELPRFRLWLGMSQPCAAHVVSVFAPRFVREAMTRPTTSKNVIHHRRTDTSRRQNPVTRGAGA